MIERTERGRGEGKVGEREGGEEECKEGWWEGRIWERGKEGWREAVKDGGKERGGGWRGGTKEGRNEG